MSCSEWKEYTLYDLVEIIGGGTPKTTVEEYWNGDINWISVKDFNGDRKYIENTEKTITELGLNKSSTKLLKEKDIVISARGTVGALGVIKKPMAFNQSCYGLRAKENLVNSDFLYYLIKNSIAKLKSNTHGSVFSTITRDTFKCINIKIPNLQEQEKIADILSSLDDKIELNNEMNKTLEEMAQSIFKRWFVDFEFPNEDGQPYKSSGGEMVESELGMIPKGWEVKTINEMVNVTDYVANGSFASLKNNVKQGEDEDYAILIRLVDHNRGFKGPYMYVDENGYNFLSKSKLYGGEIIISNVGANAGTVFKAPYLQKPMTLGPNSIMILKSTLDNYLYYYLTSDIGQNNLKGILGGSAQPKFNKTDFRNIQIVLPNDDIIEKFNSVINTIIEKIELISRENRIIESVRDNLLPKLISGQNNIDS